MKRFNSILFVAHSTTDDSAAFGQTLKLAQNNQAMLSVVTVLDDVKPHASNAARAIHAHLVADRQDELDAFVEGAKPEGMFVSTKVLSGRAFLEVIREVLRSDHDLIIKSIEPKEHTGRPGFSTTDKNLMRKCPCPVWLIKETQKAEFREILVGIDYEPNNAENNELNRRLLEMSASLAITDLSELHVIHAWQLEHERFLRGPRAGLAGEVVDAMVEEERLELDEWMRRTISACTTSLGHDAVDFLKPQFHLIRGSARTVIPEFAKDIDADLVVLGTIGRTGVPGLLMGNTAEALLDQIDCSVLAVKPSGFVSPVEV